MENVHIFHHNYAPFRFFPHHLYGYSFFASQALPYPRTLACHMQYHMLPGGEPHKSPAKYIYVMRNPKDVSISFHHYFYVLVAREHEIKYDEYFEMFVNGTSMYGSWFDHVLQWWEHRGLY